MPQDRDYTPDELSDCWTRIPYNEIEWVEDASEDSTGYGVICTIDRNGVTYQMRLFPSAGIGSDWLAWTIVANGVDVYTSNPDFNSVGDAVKDCERHCGFEALYTEYSDGWH